MKALRPTTLVAALLLMASGQANAQGSGNTPLASTPIALQGAGPYHRLTLPASLYSRAATTDLRDVRILNAAGSAVPFAWLRAEAEAPKLVSVKVPIFAVPEPATTTTTAGTDTYLAFQVRSDGSLALARPVAAATAAGNTWLIDASQVAGNLLQARFAVAAGTQGVFGFQLERSNDLRNWQRVGEAQQLVVLQHGGQSLERLTADLDGTRARFLRLRWTDSTHHAPITAITLDSEQAVEAVAPQVWSGPLKPESCAAETCDYRLPLGVPAHTLRIALADTNTLAQVRVAGVPDRSAPTTPARLHRHPFHGLHALRQQREQTRPPAAPGEVTLADTVVYRINSGGAEARSPELALDGDVYPVLRLRTQGPVSLLGATPPSIEVATIPRTLVFLAQGQPPYTLAWQTGVGAAPAPGAALALATLIPGYASNKGVQADTAQVSLAATPVSAGAPQASPAPSVATTDTGMAKLGLWAALCAGLLLLGGMAWSLLGSLKKAKDASDDRP